MNLTLGRVGETDEVAEAVAFFVSPQTQWIAGPDLIVDGGTIKTALPATKPEGLPYEERVRGSDLRQGGLVSSGARRSQVSQARLGVTDCR